MSGDAPKSKDWKALGTAHVEAKRYDEAVLAFQEAAKKHPKDSDILFNLAFSLGQLGRHAHAIEAWRKGLEVQPRSIWAWNNLGWCYSRQGRRDEAADCHRRAVAINPNDKYGWERIAEYSKGKNAKEHSQALAAIAAIEGGAESWGAAGRAYLEAGQYEPALDALRKAVDAAPGDAELYLHLGRAYRALGFPNRAAGCLRKAQSECKQANQDLAELAPQLKEIEKWAKQFQQNRKLQEAPYSGYMNPFELLGLKPKSETDDATIKRAKKQLLHEMMLNDGAVPWLDCPGRLDKSRVIRALDELEDPKKRACHEIIFEQSGLSSFLATGNVEALVSFFSNMEEMWENLFDYDEDNAIGAWYAHQYGRALLDAFLGHNAVVVGILKQGEPPRSSACWDECFRPVYEELKRITEEVSELEKNSDGTDGLLSTLKRKLEPVTISALPVYFARERTLLVQALRGAAIELHNEHRATQLSREVIEMAMAIEPDDATRQELDKDRNTVNNILAEEKRSTTLELQIGKRHLTVDKKGVSYDGSFMPLDSISSISMGIFKQYRNGSCTSRSYLVCFGSERGGCQVECHQWKMFDGQANEAASAKRFEALVNVSYRVVVPHIVEGIINKLGQGYAVPVGPCKLSKNGIEFTTGAWFWAKVCQIPWAQVRVTKRDGDVIVFGTNCEGKAVMSMRDTWNAVLLDIIAESMCNT